MEIKVAIVTPILKKYGLDLVFENFRHVINFSFAAEKAVVNSYYSIVVITPLFLPTSRPIVKSSQQQSLEYGSTGSNSVGPP